MGIGQTVFFYVVSLIILYLVIYSAVKNGINNSVISGFLEKKYNIKETEKSFLDSDLDDKDNK